MKGIKGAHHSYFHNGKILIKPYSSSPSEASITTNPTISNECNSKSLQKKAIKVNDCVKVLCEHYKGYYTIVISQSYGGEWTIQHFKKLFDKYVLKVGDFDSREPDEHNAVNRIVDQRGRYTFSE